MWSPEASWIKIVRKWKIYPVLHFITLSPIRFHWIYHSYWCMIYILIGNNMRTFTISNCQIGSTQSFHKIAAHQKSSYNASLNFNMCGAITFRCSIQFRLNALCVEIFFSYEILEFLKSAEILGIFNIWKILSSKLYKCNSSI